MSDRDGKRGFHLVLGLNRLDILLLEGLKSCFRLRWITCPSANRLPQYARTLEPKQVRDQNGHLAARQPLQEAISLGHHRFAAEQRKPLHGDVCIDYEVIHLSRSSRIICSDDGSDASGELFVNRKRLSFLRASRRAANCFSVGMLFSSRDKTSAAIERRCLRARSRRAW